MARILIIDNDRPNSQILQNQLTKSGHEVSVAHHAGLGFTHAVQVPPDLIFVDLILPDATGAQICRKLRHNPVTQFIPIIVMTALAPHPHQERFARAMGANEYIPKPLKVIQVGDMVDHYVQSKDQNPKFIKTILEITQGFFPPDKKVSNG